MCSYPGGETAPGTGQGAPQEAFLLILDEATSSLDSENEKRIQTAIEGLHGRMTILVISHRLSTIRTADMIYLIEGGRLIESGRWDLLIAPGGQPFPNPVRGTGDRYPRQWKVKGSRQKTIDKGTLPMAPDRAAS